MISSQFLTVVPNRSELAVKVCHADVLNLLIAGKNVKQLSHIAIVSFKRALGMSALSLKH